MQPNQPYYQPPTLPPTQPSTPGNGQYDFILGDDKPPSQNPFSTGGMPNKKVILTAVGGLVFVIILLAIIFNLAFGGKGGNTAPLVSLAQTQTEIARVAGAAVDGDYLRVPANKDLAQTLRLSLTTDQQDMTSYLAKHGKKLGDKQLALKQNARTDQTLSAAQVSGTYDSTFQSVIQDQLKAYAASLNQAYGTATNPTEQQLIKTQYEHAQLLLQKSGVPTES